jgi:hypothetical protein
MPKPQNAYLAKQRAKKEAEFAVRLAAHTEVKLMALLIAANRELKVGAGRAPFLLAEFIDVEAQIAQDILDDIGDSHKKHGNGDAEFLHTKKDLALTLKRILGPDAWKQYRELFPMLREYWEI